MINLDKAGVIEWIAKNIRHISIKDNKDGNSGEIYLQTNKHEISIAGSQNGKVTTFNIQVIEL